MTPAAFAKIPLSLDGAVEGAHGGHADFRAGGKVFATLGYPDKDWGMAKLAPDQQQVLVAAELAMFVAVKGTWGACAAPPQCASPKWTSAPCAARSPWRGRT
jgi:hypothetical protein